MRKKRKKIFKKNINVNEKFPVMQTQVMYVSISLVGHKVTDNEFFLESNSFYD